jgi:hypothetical protein
LSWSGVLVRDLHLGGAFRTRTLRRTAAGAAFGGLQRGETLLELVEAVGQQDDLCLEADAPLGAALDAGRAGGPLDHGVEGDEALGSVRPVDQPRRQLAAAVPGAERRAGGAGLGLGDGQGHPGEVVELGEQLYLGLPPRQPVLPGRHRVTLSLSVH